MRVQVSRKTNRNPSEGNQIFVFAWPQAISNKGPSQEAHRGRLAARLAASACQNTISRFIRIELWLLLTPKAVALVVSLFFSALLTAAALRLTDQQWLSWISFLPLFVVVRSLRPSVAALAGGFWGGCLYLCCFAGMARGVETIGGAVGLTAPATAQLGPAWLLALLTVIPAIYVGLASRSARPLGLRLLILALGWTLIEVVLHLHNAFAPQDGLLTGSHGESQHFHWFVRLLGMVVTAFLVACVNASLLGIVSAARLSFPTSRSLTGSLSAVGRLLSHVVLAIQSWKLCQAHPRAPPFRITIPI